MKKTYRIDEEGRECSRCWVYKIWDCFNKNKQSAIWYHSACKLCTYKDKTVTENKPKTQNRTNYEIEKEPLPTQSWKDDTRTAKHDIVVPNWFEFVQVGMNPCNSFYQKRYETRYPS